MTRWHHGHSLGTGVLGGLYLAGGHIMLLCLLVFTLGALTTFAAINVRRIIGWVGRRFA